MVPARWKASTGPIPRGRMRGKPDDGDGAVAIESVVVRQRVEDLDAAVPFYEKLTGSTASRFGFGGVTLASVGPFLLFSGRG